MPLYQYECEKCGEQFDVRQKFVDAPLTIHEECGGSVHRMLSAPALQFKGSGFYITDYAKNSTSQPGNGGTKKGDGSGEKSGGENSSGEKSAGDKSNSDKSSGDKSGGEKAGANKSGGEKSDSSSQSSTSTKSESKPASSSDTK